MGMDESSKLSAERIALIVVSFFLIIAIAYIVIMTLAERPASGTLPGEASPVPVEEAPAFQPTLRPTRTPITHQEITPAADAQPTPTPFRVVSEDDVRSILDLAEPFYVDYFDDPTTWFAYDSESAAYQIQDGSLVGLDYEPEERFIHWSWTSRESGNVYAEISATNSDCEGKDSVGFVIRVRADKTPSGYALEVACDGSWRFRHHRGSAAPEELIDWTPSEFIEPGPGETNRLGIWGYQGKFVLFVNGFEVGDFYDYDYSDTFGFFAAYVRASGTFNLTASFDDFAFWHIPFIP
jgi:hypothetical protein